VRSQDAFDASHHAKCEEFSTAEVLDSSGARMNAGNAVVDQSDRKLLCVPVKILPR
jgi:hypothetical protein